MSYVSTIGFLVLAIVPIAMRRCVLNTLGFFTRKMHREVFAQAIPFTIEDQLDMAITTREIEEHVFAIRPSAVRFLNEKAIASKHGFCK